MRPPPPLSLATHAGRYGRDMRNGLSAPLSPFLSLPSSWRKGASRRRRGVGSGGKGGRGIGLPEGRSHFSSLPPPILRHAACIAQIVLVAPARTAERRGRPCFPRPLSPLDRERTGEFGFHEEEGSATPPEYLFGPEAPLARKVAKCRREGQKKKVGRGGWHLAYFTSYITVPHTTTTTFLFRSFPPLSLLFVPPPSFVRRSGGLGRLGVCTVGGRRKAAEGKARVGRGCVCVGTFFTTSTPPPTRTLLLHMLLPPPPPSSLRLCLSSSFSGIKHRFLLTPPPPSGKQKRRRRRTDSILSSSSSSSFSHPSILLLPPFPPLSLFLFSPPPPLRRANLIKVRTPPHPAHPAGGSEGGTGHGARGTGQGPRKQECN